MSSKPEAREQASAASGPRRRRGRPSNFAGRQQRVYEAALRLMHEKGFQGTTIRDVAAELDFTQAAFYYFVKDKEDLLNQILLRTLETALETVSSIVDGPEAPDLKLGRIIDAYVELVANRPEMFAVYFRERGHLEPDHRKLLVEREREVTTLIEGVYEEGIKAGILRDVPAPVAVFSILGMCFWTYEWYRPGGRISTAELSSLIQHLAAEGYTLPSRRRPAR